MLKLTNNEIEAEFTKRFTKDENGMISQVKVSTRCPFCGRKTTNRTGEHYNCYEAATFEERTSVYQIRNQVLDS